jgi:hypothetical protein
MHMRTRGRGGGCFTVTRTNCCAEGAEDWRAWKRRRCRTCRPRPGGGGHSPNARTMLSGAQALGTDQDGQQIMYLEAHAEHQSNDPIEDTHTVVCGDGFSYVGVYDGHGGAQTSRFLRERSWQVFSEQLKATKDPKVAFERAWKALDETYIQECLDNPRRAGLFAGSCAVAMYFDCAQQCIWVANLGDRHAQLLRYV